MGGGVREVGGEEAMAAASQRRTYIIAYETTIVVAIFFLSDNLLGDFAIVGKDDLVDLERGLDGIRLVVDPFELFDGAPLRLDTVKLGKREWM